MAAVSRIASFFARCIASVASHWRTPGEAASAHVDMIRALAAWAVMWGHLRNLFFADVHHVQSQSAALKALYFFTGFGHQSVVIFFVLSGFLISSAVVRRHLTSTWSWSGYAIDRFSRLYVVLLPGLLCGLLLDECGSHLFASTGLYSHPLEGLGAIIVVDNLTLKTLLLNALFLQTVLAPTSGSNGPLWSLASEFWYYVLFPLAFSAVLALQQARIHRFAALAVAVCALGVFLGSFVMQGFILWLTGSALAVAFSRFDVSNRRALYCWFVITATALGSCLAYARSRNPNFWIDFSLALSFSAFLFGVLNTGVAGKRYARIAHLLSGFSYSLYVLHFPLLVFLRAWLVPREKWQPDAKHLIFAATIGLLVLVFAWLVSTFTENQTRAVRNWIRRLFVRDTVLRAA